MFYIQTFIITLFLTVILTFLVIKIAKHFNIVDKPNQERKIHKKDIPLLGGIAIFLAFFVVLYFFKDQLLVGNLTIKHWIGFFIGGALLMIGGFLDDKYNLKPSHQVIFPILAVISVISGGIEIEKMTNPFGGFISLGFLSSIFIVFWLLGMMYTTKLLDGLDGLVSGTVAIGAFIIFLFTMTTKYYQPDIGFVALILCASCIGFLFFNFHQAKIFLGEGGSLFLGYALGVLAIISGGKIAIALLVMGIPILDTIWTIIRRIINKKNPFKFADKKHLHFRLLDLGLSIRQAVLVYYVFAAIFGLIALFLQSRGKLFALIILLVIMFLFIISLTFLDRKKRMV
ncbi:MAG: MraY family glycosyltransferase [Patescibacteria group bacterium]|nr:undecaprenyl/decaprenyl-phosphate alpha-N-acetylglucosaminyl 1-phosphate transferase [Patescibacteria group bacterium]MBU0880456.1 undecaprenyl/decaprenyl-phosphate alpha-N-acetylglucosaminyl 1-phosphate transferase [Patescibacteria group bacterium]MBU1783199.1 undecaprenyl/decaprenyl-phosphate alpha-N-acetylglucosaminyl 1-phosphate transferase [Patescibacteria group bacterium]